MVPLPGMVMENLGTQNDHLVDILLALDPSSVPGPDALT
jgi:hypothetical protein